MLRTLVLFSIICLVPIFGCEKDEGILSNDKTNNESNIENADETSNETDKINNERIEKNGEIDSNNINMDVLPPELDTPIVKGLRVNVFAEKKKFKLAEPMNIIVVLRNKTDKIIKLEITYSQLSHDTPPFCTFSFYFDSDENNLPQGYFSGSWPPVTIVNISPNAVFCYVVDIQSRFSKKYVGNYTMYAMLQDEIKNNDELLESNTIEFEVVESLDKNAETTNENTIANILPPELDTPIIKGLRVNVFAEKKKFKLGEPMNIYTVIRNKSDKIIKLRTKYYIFTSQNCYFSMHTIHENYPPLTGFRSGSDWPSTVEINISSNATYCFVNDIQHLFNEQSVGKFRFFVNLKDDLWGSSDDIKSNIIEFEVVN